MDFFRICVKETKDGFDLYPDFIVGRSQDLMVRGKAFYAIWDEAKGLWSTDEYDVQRLVDQELRTYADNNPLPFNVKYMSSHSSGSWARFKNYINSVSDNSHQLDESLTFANTPVKKTDYVSRRLPYALEPGDTPAWDELVGTLYSIEERAKIEWFIGAIVSGDSKKIQKFGVFYGPPGSGKGTVLDIIERLFPGYTAAFDAKALGSNGAEFATEVFKNNPLVAIQQDGDLSRIEDNARLNTVISHENMPMNEKYKAGYTARVNALCLLGTNQPVKITDAKSGLLRRLIDIHPTGVRIPENHYYTLMAQVNFELGAIASHCLDVYQRLGRNHYTAYRPLNMMYQTDVFFNFIEAYFDVFKRQNSTSLKQAYAMYKEYCNETNIGVNRTLPQYKFREELKNYFDDMKERGEFQGEEVRSLYVGFNVNKFKQPSKEPNVFSVVLEETTSLLDKVLEGQPAQYATENETPKTRWENVKTKLSDIDTTELHFVKMPQDHIVIDFDLKDLNGHKSLERNLEAASAWPPTYGELSKSGSGVHLHYDYEGDADALSRIYSEGIEIKVFRGDSSLRRRLTRCNATPVGTLAVGSLPLKEKKVITADTMKSEKNLRALIERNLRKEIHGYTKPSIQFIKKILDDAYESDLIYDVENLRPRVMVLAANSSNHADECLKIMQQMKFKSDEAKNPGVEIPSEESDPEVPIVLFDVEVYPNLFVVCWKYRGSSEVVRMINPTSQEIEPLLRMKLIGFYNRRYDNHILYAAWLGASVEQLYELSQKMIVHNTGFYGEAYNLSYADIWDFASIKQTLKKWEIQLGIKHMEMDIPWDEPVPENRIADVVEYCVNDVNATEAVLDDREGDFVARKILAELSGLSVNDTTQKHTARIIFGKDPNPSAKFVYTELKEEFPGYVYDMGKSTYRGEETGEGGYVYAEPGLYENVALLDVVSMHPTSIRVLNLFGDYTPRFAELVDARVAIKRKDYDLASQLMGGKLAPFLVDAEEVYDIDKAEALAYALKIVINIVYGLTSARFDNPFKDIRNKDNIVAKRGALFMIDLKHFVQERGFTVAHIKTDSIKIPNATPEIIREVTLFGEKYGYTFEHEATYDKFCLVNDAVYVAKEKDKWKAVGAQFQHPYVFKTLFTDETPDFEDLFEARSVIKGAMYLDFHGTGDVAGMHFVGRTGLFVPVTENSKGGVLYRVVDGKPFAVTGTKGYMWVETHLFDAVTDEVDMRYYMKLVEDAVSSIEKFDGGMDRLLWDG